MKKKLLLIILVFIKFPIFSQNEIDGALLFNIKRADTSRYYSYLHDKRTKTLIKYDSKYKIKSYKFLYFEDIKKKIV